MFASRVHLPMLLCMLRITVLILSAAVLLTGVAQASSNVPLHHWSYDAIDRLTAMGIIDQAMIVTKPYSRKQAAVYVSRALERVRKDQVDDNGQQVLAEPMLRRLLKEFKPELMDLGALPKSPEASRAHVRYGAQAQLEADTFHVAFGGVRLRENRMGEYYANGEQVQASVRGWLELTDWLTVTAKPKYISDPHLLGLGATNNTKEAYMQEFNVKLTQWNVSLEVGRGSQWWGPGYRGTLLLSDHAFPLDMIKLGSEDPFRLPGFLQSLGQWKVNSFVTQLDRDREFPRTKVFGLRISYMPTDWLEMGVARLTMYDGRGNTGGDQTVLPAIIFDAYTHDTNKPGVNKVNEEAMFDFRVRVPSVPYLVPFPSGMQFYGELGLEDPPNGLGVVLGAYIPQVFKGDTMDLRIEFADTNIRGSVLQGASTGWYNNGTYVSGMRYRGYPLGHWVGTDGIDLYVRTSRYLTDTLQTGAYIEFESQGRQNPVYETKQEGSVDLTWLISSHFHLTGGFTYQRIKNPVIISSLDPYTQTFASGVTSDNRYGWVMLTMQF
jgi:hypothetical protein